MMVKIIEYNNTVYAKIIRAISDIQEDTFFSSDDNLIQFGVLNYPKKHKTGAHYHNHLKSKTTQTDEILILQNGSLRVDFYDNEGGYIKSSELFANDVLITYCGAHNLFFYEDTKVIVIKTGAYNKECANTRIIGTNNSELIIEND